MLSISLTILKKKNKKITKINQKKWDQARIHMYVRTLERFVLSKATEVKQIKNGFPICVLSYLLIQATYRHSCVDIYM